MTGARLICRKRCAGILSRLGAVLWFVTALSVLQWSAPTIDPSLFARLQTSGGQAADFIKEDRSVGPVVEAHAASSAMVADKRISATRTLAPAKKDADSALPPVLLAASARAARASGTERLAIPHAADDRASTARGPPPRA